MRVTQSMLSQNMLRNLTGSYTKMGGLQEQLNTGKKVTRPTDDPVIVMKGLGFGMQVDKIKQFQRNLGEVNNWLDSADDALDGVGNLLHRVRELSTNAANTGTMTPSDREKIKIELGQLQEQLQDLANTKVGDKYIFSGTMTDQPLFDKVTGAYATDPAFQKKVTVEVFEGINLQINSDTAGTFNDINELFQGIKNNTDDTYDFSAALGELDVLLEDVLTKRADIGARANRAELMDDRLQMQDGAARKQRSENEDVHYEVTITDLITSESIHRATLSIGARIIQPSLMDFLR